MANSTLITHSATSGSLSLTATWVLRPSRYLSSSLPIRVFLPHGLISITSTRANYLTGSNTHTCKYFTRKGDKTQFPNRLPTTTRARIAGTGILRTQSYIAATRTVTVPFAETNLKAQTLCTGAASHISQHSSRGGPVQQSPRPKLRKQNPYKDTPEHPTEKVR